MSVAPQPGLQLRSQLVVADDALGQYVRQPQKRGKRVVAVPGGFGPQPGEITSVASLVNQLLQCLPGR
jgi:molybdopterin-biosynthesis enzyme MoeA-like protein